MVKSYKGYFFMNNNNKEKLASRLLYLPIDLNEKVLLWLTYKGLKPVSEITALKRNRAHLRRMMRDPLYKKSYKSPYDFDSRSSKRIRKWINDAGLYLAIEPEYETAWHVGSNPEQVKTSTKLLHKFDIENEIKTGLMFGFPEVSVRAYAENRNKSDEEIENVMVGTGDLLYKDPYLKDKYFTPYVFYNIPKSKVVEQSQVAKKWADTIREDVSQLATWFENAVRDDLGVK